MIRRLQKKFVLAAIVSVFLVLFFLIGAINFLNYRNLINEADSTLQILAENNGSFPGTMRRMQDVLPEAEPLPETVPRGRPFGRKGEGFGELAYQSRYFAVWFDREGNTARSNLENIATMQEEDAVALAEAVYTRGRTKGFSDEYRYSRTENDSETMLLFLNCQRELWTFRVFLYSSIGISLIGLLAVLVLLLLLSGRIVHPIAESYEKQKQFITDAGHELKTPITIIRADADVLESEMEEENEWIADIRRQTNRLTELTEDLIYLSKMEEENPALRLQRFSFSELVQETVDSFQAPALMQKKDFSLSVASGVDITGDRKAVGKLVSVLLDNAVKYSPEDRTVEVVLSESGKYARLAVRNSTESIEKGNQDRLFERFARGDASRNSESGGFGLGLAIAKAVAEAHKGKIHAESEDGKSLTVTAELPLE